MSPLLILNRADGVSADGLPVQAVGDVVVDLRKIVALEEIACASVAGQGEDGNITRIHLAGTVVDVENSITDVRVAWEEFIAATAVDAGA